MKSDSSLEVDDDSRFYGESGTLADCDVTGCYIRTDIAL